MEDEFWENTESWKKNFHLIILIGNVKTNIFLDDISAKHYLSEQKHKSHLFLYAADMLKISAWLLDYLKRLKTSAIS